MKAESNPIVVNTHASEIIIDHPCYVNARESLQSCLDSFGTAKVWCLPLLGPSGSGKTTLVKEFADSQIILLRHMMLFNISILAPKALQSHA